jgi:hypothetical protein
MPTFLHSGDIGDMIYSLIVIRALGGGTLYMDLEHKSAPICRTTEVSYELLRELFLYQPYVKDFRIWHGEPIDFPMDGWRNMPDILKNNIADSHLRLYMLPSAHRDVKWLDVPGVIKIPGKPHVIARSSRVHANPTIYKEFLPTAVFVGLDDEYKHFCETIGSVERYEIDNNYMTFAKLIAGSELFIGNNSSGFAIAEGLKANVYQETNWGVPNTVFRRDNARYSDQQ